ncbi:copper chaperone PCu(A)C [Chromatiaceae bacterium AAb-1]|jgi:copper(I)-binding protein|nr:copper chaperone PCu(A)C [Chromatiaceae bacterium AAb-1]
MRFIFTLLAFVTLSFCTLASAGQDIVFTEAQVRVPMPGRTVTAGYLTLTNHGHDTASLVVVESPAFQRIELHQHVHHDGMMHMEQIKQIDIATHSSVQLKPGGLHLMLFEPAKPLVAGETVALTFRFADNQTFTIDVPLVNVPKR